VSSDQSAVAVGAEQIRRLSQARAAFQGALDIVVM